MLRLGLGLVAGQFKCPRASVIRVRRSSNNDEMDITARVNIDRSATLQLTTGDLDETTLLDFVGNGDGFVTKWYDISGNGNDGEQTTASAQPKIVSAGTVQDMSFDGGDRITVPISLLHSDNKTISFWWKSSDETRDYVFQGSGTQFPYLSLRFSIDQAMYRWVHNSYQYWAVADADYNDGNWHFMTLYPDDTDIGDSEMYIDNEIMTKDGGGFSDSEPASASCNIGNNFTGGVANIRLWDRVLSESERTTLFNQGH